MSCPTFEVFTAFPRLVDGFLAEGLMARAREGGRLRVDCTDFRAFTTDRHGTLDDAPFGGGPGMVMRIEPVVAALEHVAATRGPFHRVLLSPSGPRFDQAAARRLATLPRIGLLCGRYEGFDDRVREHFVDEVLSIGDFVLNGGEVAALAIIEAVARLCEGVVGNPESLVRESFATDDRGGLLEYPQYTRPAEFRGLGVPEVLLSGDHEAIAAYRARASSLRTWVVRPDLRAVDPLPAEVPIYLALSAGTSSSELAGELAASLAGVLVLGDGDPVAWARTLGGRVGLSSFSDPATCRGRLRRRHGAEPLWVRVSDGEASTHAAAVVLDAWWSGAARGPVVLAWRGAVSGRDGDLEVALEPGRLGDLVSRLRSGVVGPRR